MPPKEKTEFGLSLREENRRKRQRQQNDSDENTGSEVPVGPTAPAASAALHLAPNQEEEMPIEPVAEGGEGEEVSDHPARPDDDVHDNEAGPPVANELPPPLRSDADAPAAASGPRLRLRFPADGAAPGPPRTNEQPPPPSRSDANAPAATRAPLLRLRPSASGVAPPPPAAVPPANLTDHQREMAAITTNWGPESRTLRDCIKANTWFKGSIVNLTEETCEIETLRKLRELSDKTPNGGAKMKEQMDFHWRQRDKQGRVGGTKLEKQENLREDLQLLIDGKRMKEEDIQTYKGRPKGDGDASARKRNAGGKTPDRTKRVRQSTEDDEDESSSGDSIILHDGPAPKKADGGVKAAAIAKQNGAATNARRPTVLTEAGRRQALSDIYINWGLYQLHLQFPRGLFPTNITSDTDIDLRLLARLLDLSNLYNSPRQAFALRDRIMTQSMQSFIMARSPDEALAFLAPFDRPTPAAVPTPGGPTTRATTANLRGEPSMRELERGTPLPTPGTTRLSAAEMLARQSRSDNDPPGEPMVLTEEERERRRRNRERYPTTAPPLTNHEFRASQAATHPVAQPGLSRFEGGVLIIGSNWTLRRALNDSRQADQRIEIARREYEHAVLNGQSVQDQAALLLGMEKARGVSDAAYARTDELQERWARSGSRRSTLGDGLGRLTGDSGQGRSAQAEGAGEEEDREGQQGGDGGGNSGAGLGEGRKKTKKQPKKD